MKKSVMLLVAVSFILASDGFAQRTIGTSRDPVSNEAGSRNPGGRPAETRPDKPPAVPPPPETHRPPVHPHPVVPPPPVLIGGPVCILPVPPAPVIVVERIETRSEPETNEVVLHDKNSLPGKSGFDFSAEDVGAFSNTGMDFFFSASDEGPEFIVREDTDIQDLGQIDAFPELESIPLSEWSPTRRVHAEPDNFYVVWTWDNQYYAFRVISISENRISFEWAKIAGGSRIPSDLAYRNGETRRNSLLAKFGK